MSNTRHAALVVIGETMAGIFSAVTAARAGLSVLLVTYKNSLGGAFPSLGAIETHYGGVRSPLLLELRDRILGYYRDVYGEDSEQFRTCVTLDPDIPMITFEPHVAGRIIAEMVEAEARIRVLRRFYPLSVEIARDRILAVRLAAFDEDAQVWAEGEIFIDATYEGDLAAAAGVPYRIGREARSEYNELHAGRLFTRWLHGRFPVDAAEGRLNIMPKWTTMGLMNGSTGEGDDNIQDYSYRLCLSSDPDNRILPDKPPGYDRNDYLAIAQTPDEIGLTRYALHHRFLTDSLRDMIAKDHLFHGHALPNHKRSWNATNLTGVGKAYPDSNWETRRQIAQRHVDHALGILYFLQNDDAIPPDIRDMARAWGLAKDEFVENDHIPEHMYIREGRRIVGRYTYNENDGVLAPGLKRAPIHPDSIGITEFPLDSLPCTTERMPGSLADGQMFLMEISRPGQIPFRVVLPQRLQNLMVPLCASVSHVAWGTVRQTPTLMHLGESVGMAATLAIGHRTPPGRLSVHLLQRRLVENGVMLSFFNDFDMATGQPWVAAVQYLGTKGFFRSYDARPDDPLTTATASVWAEITGCLLHGTQYDPGDYARRLPDDDADRQMAAVTAADLAAMLPGSVVDTDQAAGQRISRGAACRWIYDALWTP